MVCAAKVRFSIQFIALCCYHAKRCDKQTCSIPYCGLIKKRLAVQKRAWKQLLADNESCGICLDKFHAKESSKKSLPEKPALAHVFPDTTLTPCGHLFHSECLKKWQDHQKTISKKPNCPYCRTVFKPL
jgi:hypothetical protein